MFDYNMKYRIVVNFFHHVQGYSIEESEKLFSDNSDTINKVFALFGDDVMINILEGVTNED